MNNTFPSTFEHRMQQRLGKDWDAFAAVIQSASPTSIRRNPFKPVQETVGPPVPWSRHGYYLEERPRFTLDPTLHAGAYYVQEASSMFLELALRHAVDLTRPLRVLDLCAAPGGKSTLLAGMLSPESLLVSNEVIRSRAGILAENLQKWGTDSVVVTNNDPEDFQRLPGFFDVIVVDAPCSGEGLFRKDPQAMKEWSEENVQLCSKRQRRILSDVWSSLKENGVLIYSTCTYNELENEDNLRWLRDECNVEFLSVKIDSSWNIEEVNEGDIKGYRFYPHRVKGEGFFLSVIRKKEPEDEYRIKGEKNFFTLPSRKIIESLYLWVLHPEEKTFIQRNDVIQFFPTAAQEAIEVLVKNLKIVSAGTFVATLKHDKLIPEHALALSVNLQQDHFEKLDVSLEDALRYLRKETLPAVPGKRGFALVLYNQLPLGWVNLLPNRINNLYPSEWRIRMSQ
jgi:16S rRNA C967 or C1407 C5-methylase (RsmB/RsmF family)/NOL1/NOP2/fmu family ribosome biogenesis protein